MRQPPGSMPRKHPGLERPVESREPIPNSHMRSASLWFLNPRVRRAHKRVADLLRAWRQRITTPLRDDWQHAEPLVFNCNGESLQRCDKRCDNVGAGVTGCRDACTVC